MNWTPDDLPGTVALLDMNHIIMPIISGVCNPRTKKPYTMGIGVFTLGKEEWTGPPQDLADYMRSADVALMLPEPPEHTSMATYNMSVSCDQAPPVTGYENAPFVRTSRSSLVRILTDSYRRSDSMFSFVVLTETVLSFLESKQHGTAAVSRSRYPSVVPWEEVGAKGESHGVRRALPGFIRKIPAQLCPCRRGKERPGHCLRLRHPWYDRPLTWTTS